MDKEVINNKKPKQQPNDVANIESVERALNKFKVIDTKRLKYLVNSALVSSMTAIAFFVSDSWYTREPVEVLYVSGGFALIFYLLLANELFEKFPNALKVLWRRDIFRLPNKDLLNLEFPLQAETILKFLQDTRVQFNSRLSILFGFIGFCIGSWLVWLFDQSWALNFSDYLNSIPIPLTIVLFLRASLIFTCFVSGIIAWHILVVGIRISALGKQFGLNLKINHPDGCGGLSPIGDLCLKIAYCIVPFLIILGTWLVFINILDISYLHMFSDDINSLIYTLQILLLPLVFFSFLSFFLPTISIRNSMLNTKFLLDSQLDVISQKIHLIEVEILTQADHLSKERRITLEENLDFLKRSYNRLQSIPTWPFKQSHLFRLTSSQIIPLFGVASSLITFFREVTK